MVTPSILLRDSKVRITLYVSIVDSGSERVNIFCYLLFWLQGKERGGGGLNRGGLRGEVGFHKFLALKGGGGNNLQ